MNNQPKFATKRGFLTYYAHRCGYVDTADIGSDTRAIALYLDGTYHVRVAPAKDRPRIWDVFEPNGAGRKQAQKRFMQLVREYKATRKRNKP